MAAASAVSMGSGEQSTASSVCGTRSTLLHYVLFLQGHPASYLPSGFLCLGSIPQKRRSQGGEHGARTHFVEWHGIHPHPPLLLALSLLLFFADTNGGQNNAAIRNALLYTLLCNQVSASTTRCSVTSRSKRMGSIMG